MQDTTLVNEIAIHYNLDTLVFFAMQKKYLIPKLKLEMKLFLSVQKLIANSIYKFIKAHMVIHFTWMNGLN